MSKKGRFSKIKREIELRSIAKSRQSNAEKLKRKLKKLSTSVVWTEALQDKLNEHRMAYAQESRELAEKAMADEVAIYEDLKLQLQK